jgi:hypothetical protein
MVTLQFDTLAQARLFAFCDAANGELGGYRRVWDVVLHSLVEAYRRFGGTHCFNVWAEKTKARQAVVCASVPGTLTIVMTLNESWNFIAMKTVQLINLLSVHVICQVVPKPQAMAVLR